MCRRGENIYKRADGRYEGRYIKGRLPNGKIQYGYIYSTKYMVVKRRLAEKRNQFQDGGKVCPDGIHPSLTTNAWAEKWRASPAFEKLKPSTREKYLQMLALHILPFFGPILLHEIDERMILEFIDDLKKENLADSTIRDNVQLLKNLMREAVRHKQLDKIPEMNLPLREKAACEIEILSKEEQKRLREAAQSKDLPSMLSLMTGVRLGEACALRWEDIDESNCLFHVRGTAQRLKAHVGTQKTELVVMEPKTASSRRIIPLSKDLMQELLQQREIASAEQYIFGKNQQPADPRNVQRQFQDLLKRAGVPPHRFHCLRHTFTTRLLEKQVDIKTISTLLGHGSIRTTMDIYAHSQLDTKRRAIDLISEDLYPKEE